MQLLLSIKNKDRTTLFLFTLSITLFILFHIIYFKNMMNIANADVARELDYISAVIESGSLIPSAWANGPELTMTRPIILMALIYTVTNELLLTFKVGFLLANIILFCSMYFYLKTLDVKESSRFCFLCLYWSLFTFDAGIGGQGAVNYNCPDNTWEYIVIFFSLGVYNKYFYSFKWVVVAAALCFMMGLCGPKLLSILGIPLLLYEIIKYFRYKRKSIRFYTAVIIFIGNMLGTAIFSIYLAPKVGFTLPQSNNTLSVITVVHESFGLNVASLLMAAGIRFDKELTTLWTMLSFVHVGLLIGCIFFWINTYVDKMHRNNYERCICSFWGLSVLLMFVFCIFTLNDVADRYYLNFSFLLLLSIMMIYDRLDSDIFYRKWLVCIVVGISFLQVASFCDMCKQNQNFKYQELIDYLSLKDYDGVYANFDTAGMVEMLSNGKISTAHFKTFDNGMKLDLRPYLWLINVHRYDYRYGNYALVISDDEINRLTDKGREKLSKGDFVCKIGDQNIFDYSEVPIPRVVLPDDENNLVHLDFCNSGLYKRGEIIDGALFSNKNEDGDTYILWGPYLFVNSLYRYKITITYEYIDNDGKAVFDINSSNKKVIMSRELAHGENQCIVDDVKFKNAFEVEFRIYKEHGTGIIIKNISIERN